MFALDERMKARIPAFYQFTVMFDNWLEIDVMQETL